MITQGQLVGSITRIRKILNGLDKIVKFPETPGEYGYKEAEVHLAISCLERAIRFFNKSIADLENDGDGPAAIIPASGEYNFDANTKPSMVREIKINITEELVDAKLMYIGAGDSKVKPSCKPFFFSHLITAIMAIDEAEALL